MFLEAEDPERDINLYINSPGGSITAGMAIYDTMQFIKNDVTTICVGQCASMGALLLCAGAAEKTIFAAERPGSDSPAIRRSFGTGDRCSVDGGGDHSNANIDVEESSHTTADSRSSRSNSTSNATAF